MGSKKAATGGSHGAQTPPPHGPKPRSAPPASSWARMGREGALQKGKPQGCPRSYKPTISHKELGAGGVGGVHWLPCISPSPPQAQRPQSFESPPSSSLVPVPRHPRLTGGVPQPAAIPRSHQTAQEAREQRGLLWDPPPDWCRAPQPVLFVPYPPLRRERSRPALLCPSPAPSQPKGADTAGPFLLLAPSGQRAGVQKGPL